MLTALGLLFAAVPLIAWGMVARTRVIGSVFGAVLLACAGLLIAVQHGWVPAHRVDAHALYALGTALLVAFGGSLERRLEGRAPAEWVHRRNGAVGLLGTQIALTLCGCLLYVAVAGASVPSARAVPPLPPGLTVLARHSGCGSGNCYRLLEIGSTSRLSREEIVRKLDRPHETCRPNGWLLDRRDLCVGVDDSGDQIRLYVTLSDLMD
ncbi:hypothetical protein [Streptomyces sp. AK02-01A]|uniref:hypothetical protein n=1 Tax=Streptomyces sp. AK02-01A TaxID=3028648 RepID=UPI0029A7848E|nr:hypothetical protein [Streptomyces sp. AK02-01A]MDX3852755.1 hypothetical protein [Streptomyces sp. AK02-01A]